VASNDFATVEGLLGPRDVNGVCFGRIPAFVVPWNAHCWEIVVGLCSTEMTKYLLEFHGARPTRETLKMAIAAGSSELINMMRERLPEAELRDRFSLIGVAAESHQDQVLRWLYRGAPVFDGELLGVFALEWKPVDSLTATFESGIRPLSMQRE
jgi:hypothetical protein